MRGFFATVFLWFPLLFFAYSVNAETCLVCHSAMTGKVRVEKGVFIELNIDENRFSKSVHSGLECTMCHKAFTNNPHGPQTGEVSKNITDLADLISTKAKTDPLAYASCVECHEDIYKSLSESIHGKNIMEKKEKDGPLCLDCHGSPHYIMPGSSEESHVNKWKVVETCGGCHEKKDLAEKYNFGTHIIEKYNESFHGKKHKLGHSGAPTCVDCHGAHGIKKWDDPASPVSWEKRTETCGKCHEGANKKFVAAITHKPVGKDNPIPFYGEKGLIILTAATLIFVIVHVALEIYADIRDNVFRKKEEHHD